MNRRVSLCLSVGKLDDQGSMEIGRHGGPNGRIFYDGREADTVHLGEDASDFASRFGGEVFSFEDIDRSLIASTRDSGSGEEE